MKLFVCLFLFSISCYSQTSRDSLYLLFSRQSFENEESYLKGKDILKDIESVENQINAELRYSFLEEIFKYRDYEFFKKTLKYITKNNGFNVAYLKGSEIYYKEIFEGSLSKWFKKMYIKNHCLWLKQNLAKESDIYKLNTLSIVDQNVNNTVIEILQNSHLNEEQRSYINSTLNNFYYNNTKSLRETTQRIDYIPNANSFALIQNNYRVVEYHNLYKKENFDRYWSFFKNYYIKTYKKGYIPSIMLYNIDYFHKLHYGKQIFNF